MDVLQNASQEIVFSGSRQKPMLNVPPESYTAFRLADQLNFFQQRTRALERRARLMRWLMDAGGGCTEWLSLLQNAVSRQVMLIDWEGYQRTFVKV